jgi:hypothetical protein
MHTIGFTLVLESAFIKIGRHQVELVQEEGEIGRIKLLKGFVAYFLQHLNEVSGRTFDMNTYFS